ncbi:ABC transporter ATP-binding protein [Streptomyces paludis]|uniref:ABC transporter ATP-binding protein n=1 Tax=Streptomyces paludis TaxID=2282738 RepID=A0A345HWH5_9ACTN|nr:ABC transporter ATP-binding protein [Streptomyces paludis]AXG81049.1 ABC transporter ATP-binding protein [Streptomyces paludis]
MTADPATTDPETAAPTVTDAAGTDRAGTDRAGTDPAPVDPASADFGASARLPVAGPRQVRSAARDLVRGGGRTLVAAVLLSVLATVAGLVGPWLVGRIINTVRAGGGVADVDRYALTILVCVLAQFLLTRYARLLAYRVGERASARIRERLVDRALALPTATVERAGAGDLTARGTTDVAAVGTTLRDAGPAIFIAGLEVLFIVGAVLVLAPPLGVVGLLGLTGIWFAARWYLRRARTAYLAQGDADSVLAEVLSATATGARTVEAFGLQERRIAVCEEAVEESRRTRIRTLFLRSVLFPAVDVSYVVPVVGVLLAGSLLHGHGAVSLGTVVTCALYMRQLSQPLDEILQYLDQLQGTGASFARVEGVGAGDTGPVDGAAGPVPADDRIEVSGVRYAYDGGRDVLRGVDLAVRPGERLAVVGPSGAGKSTLGRLLAGIDRPREGAVTVGRVPIAELGPDELRRQVVLVTQEHHVFIDTVRDNLLIAAPGASDDEVRAALAAVGADWVDGLPAGLDTLLGAGEEAVDGARAQQLALARVVLADPHTIVLDEATALLDPASARHAERALAAVLAGRTVIAIAHRLHTARDADRVAVMDDGRLTELGTHDALVARGGAYVELWHTWHGPPSPPSREPSPPPSPAG